MKKLLTIALAITMLAALLSMSANAALDLTYEAPKGTPVLDGTVEALWDTAAWADCSINAEDNMNNDGFAVRFKVLWDETAIYVLADVTDPDPSANYPDDPNKWDQDSFEVYLDELNCKAEGVYDDCDRQSRFVALNNGVFGGGGTYLDACESFFVATDTGYLCEAKLIMKTTTNKEGNLVGLDVQGNNANADGFLNWVRWNAESADNPYMNPAGMGTVKLVAAPAVAEPEPAPVEETPAVEEPVVEEPVVEAPVVVETPAAQTADLTAVMALTAVIALAGIALSRKSK